jgi:hypothetical protein
MSGTRTAVLGATVIFILLSFQMLDFEGNQNFLVTDFNPSQGTGKFKKIASPTLCHEEVRCCLDPRHKHFLKPFSLTENSEIQLDLQALMAEHMVFEQKIDGSCGDIQQFRNCDIACAQSLQSYADQFFCCGKYSVISQMSLAARAWQVCISLLYPTPSVSTLFHLTPMYSSSNTKYFRSVAPFLTLVLAPC